MRGFYCLVFVFAVFIVCFCVGVVLSFDTHVIKHSLLTYLMSDISQMRG